MNLLEVLHCRICLNSGSRLGSVCKGVAVEYVVKPVVICCVKTVPVTHGVTSLVVTWLARRQSCVVEEVV